LDDDLFKSVWRQIDLSLSNTGAWPEYIRFARLALSGGQQIGATSDRSSSRWALLPGLCCQAAGGDPHWADGVSASWIMFYLAADLMDSVEDQDEPDAWWAEFGPALAINVATGLFFSASRSLVDSCRHEIGFNPSDLIEDFHTSFIKMCGGQHLDITNPEPSLEDYWKIAEIKSGTFFSLACRSGARLAKADSSELENYGGFGNHLGILIQILDDLDDLNSLRANTLSKNSSSFFRSLPVVYALEVSPATIQGRLKRHLLDINSDPQVSSEVLKLIERSGAVLFIMTEIEQHKQKALDCLEHACPQSPSGDKLAEMILQLGTSK